MKIIVYIEPLKTFTSGMPHRGMLIELIQIRKNDYFILVLRKGYIPDFLKDLFEQLQTQKNWELHMEGRTGRISNLQAFFQFKNHCNISAKGDVYLNIDAHFLGKRNHPQIVTVHDLSSVKKTGTSSISFIKRQARKFSIINGICNADKIVSISEFTKNDILSSFNTKKSIVVIHNGIDSRWHNFKDTHDGKIKNYWIWWGGFSKRKNLKNLLLAYELLHQSSDSMAQSIPFVKLIGNQNQHYLELKEIVDSSQILSKYVSFFPHMRLNY